MSGSRRWLAALLGCVALALALSGLGANREQSEPAREQRASARAVVDDEPELPKTELKRDPVRPSPAPPLLSARAPDDRVDMASLLEPSHPITPARDQLQHELQLIGALNDALDRGDVAHMRTLIDGYRLHHPRDEERMREGYERIADCLEFPSEPTRRAAQAYYDDARASTLRRFVRRTCLEVPGS